jgi:hypothetical protein
MHLRAALPAAIHLAEETSMKVSLARPFRSLTIGLSLLLCLAPPLVAADHRGAPPKDLMPLEEILAKAKQDKAGRVVEVELDRDHGRYVYEVEIIDDAGVEWELKYDARTGQLLRTERDD